MSFLHDPISDIQSIANNLRDRYKSGFPILKEIVQNADDAKAENLVIGWHPGLINSVHPLLRDPGMFFVNDAPLTDADVKGIRTLGLGSKADDTNAVGKFGLGMKSLFHLGELYFFIGSDWQEYQGDYPKADILNPWGDLRDEWNSFSSIDKKAIQQALSSVTDFFGDDAYKFIVWIPLRSVSIAQARGEDGNNYIYNSEDYGQDVPNFLIDSNLAAQLGKLFPMLKHLRIIKGCSFTANGLELRELFFTEIDQPINRIHFPSIKSEVEWSGSIHVRSIFGEQVTSINYVGNESILVSEQLNLLKKNKFWPISYARDASGKEQKVLDKAQPHAITLLLATPSCGQAKLTVRWAVFLPLGEQDIAEEKQVFEVNIAGDMSFDVLLHGYFFIDAGRIGIHGRKSIGSKKYLDIDSEDAATQEWNRLLANQGTLPALLASLALAVSKWKLNQQQIESLSCGIRQFLEDNMGKSYHYYVTDKYQWVYQLSKESRGWNLVSSALPVRKLPKPNSGEYERVWDTFPSLLSLSDKFVFIEKSKSNINSSNDEYWRDDELVELFNSVKSNVFNSQKLLGYLIDFLEIASVHSERCQMALITMVQSAFKSTPLTKLSKNQMAIRKFIGFIQGASRWVVKVEKDEQLLWDVFSSVESSMLFVPAFLDNSDSKGALEFDCADRLFTQLSKQELNDSQLSKATDSILGSFKGNEKESLLQRHDKLKLFRAYKAGSHTPYRESISNLRNLIQRKRLFSRSSMNSGSFSYGGYLRDALDDSTVVFINNDVNQQLFSGKILPCEMQPVLDLLLTRPKLKESKVRANLISKLEITDNLNIEQRLSIRYLIHGNPEDRDISTSLWSVGSDDAVWSRVHKASISDEQSWTIIPHELSTGLKLNPLEKKVLNLKEVNANRVVDKLGTEIQRLDFQKVITNDYDAENILEKIEDAEIWCRLPLHKTLTGEYCAIEKNCFLEIGIELPDGIKKDISWISPALSKEVQRQQRCNIKNLDYATAIKLALEQDNPSNYQNFILSSIEKWENFILSSIEKRDDIDDPVIVLLKQSRWLKSGDLTLSPNMVVYTEIESWFSANELSKYSCDFCFAEDLDIFQTAYFENIKKLLVSSEINIAKLVLESAGKLTDYAIGKAKVTPDVICQARQHSGVFNGVNLKGWELLIECSSNVPEGCLTEDLLNHLTQKLTSSNGLIQIHENLVAASVCPKSICALRAVILTMICHQPNPLHALTRLKLRSVNNDFMPSSSLCYGVVGVSLSSVLHRDDFKVIQNVLPLSDKPTLQDEALIKQIEDQNFQNKFSDSSVKNIQNYFSNWDPFITNKTAIGVVLALMSGHAGIRKLCKKYIGQRTFDNFIGEIGKNWDSTKRTYNTLSQFVSKVQFDIKSENDPTIVVKSILGEKIEVELEKDAESIFVWNTTRLFYSGPISVQLRKLPVVNMDEDKLLSILKNSAELFLAKIYQQELTLDHIWDDFSGAEQLDIKAALLTVLDGIVHQLKELRLKVPELKKLLTEYDDLLVSDAENHQFMDSKRKDELLQKIGNEVRSEGTKKQILAAIKQKIEQAQYQPSSVPFELFQNADDAVVELNDLGFNEDEIHRRGVFKVDIDDGGMSFSHWGREINQYSSLHCDTDKSNKGFKTDLQKMLVRNQSDKGDSTTGKFGLGFKSCLLISDSPNIVSGRLAVQIEGGLLPAISPEHEMLFRRTKNEMLDGRLRPTIILLPLREGIDGKAVLNRFRKQAGLLTVFSKGIHTIECDGDLFQWKPTALTSIKRIEIGHVRVPTKKNSKEIRVARIKSPSGCFVFALDGNGFKPLGKEAPKLWNLSPLMGELGIGFALNADFEVDIGRNQLALSSPRNKELFELLGRELKECFENIYLACKSDWLTIKAEFKLVDELCQEDFWASLWKALWGNTSGSGQLLGSDDLEDYTHRLFAGEGGILSFYRSYPAFPTNMKGLPQKLVNLAIVSSRTGELVDKVLKHLIHLPVISELLDRQKLIGYDVGAQVLKLGVELNTLELSQILDLTLEGGELSPSSAEQLLNIFNSKFEKVLKEQKATHDQVEQFRRKLSELKVKVRNGSYRSLKQALFVNEQVSNKDEAMIIQFAPCEFITSDHYAKSIRFLEFCRRDVTPYNLDELYKWTCRVDVQNDENKQKSICEYIVKGFWGEKLADIVKKKHSPMWLFEVDVKHLERWGWDKKQIDMFRNVRMVTDTEIYLRVGIQLRSEGRSRLSTQESLMRIYAWWERECGDWLPKYENELYPSGLFEWEAIRQDEQPERFQLAWLKLFFLGSCQTIGRSKEVQHQAALNHFEQKGWWSVFSNIDDPSAWFDVMDQYLSDAMTNDKYRIWLQILPLYRFSSYLDEYIDLFLMSGNALPNIDALISPRTNSAMSGAGSSFSPPELKATLGIGTNFILRELYRHDIYQDESLEKHCFVASKGVRDLLSQRLFDFPTITEPSAKSSEEIYKHLCTFMGEEYATFGGAFDIPLRILARSENSDLLKELLEIGAWN